jgi:putative transposase
LKGSTYDRPSISLQRTANRRHILAPGAIDESFIRFGEEGSEHGAWIGAYVLMPDHIHAFVAIDDQKLSLSRWMKSLKNTLSKTMRSKGILASHWQRTFFDHVLRSAESRMRKNGITFAKIRFERA